MATGRRNTEEYRKIILCTADLTKLVIDENKLVRLCEELVNRRLINNAQRRDLTNVHAGGFIKRTSDLIGIVTTRVELNPKKLEEFTKALKSIDDDDTYEEVIKKLKGKYLTLRINGHDSETQCSSSTTG